MLTSFNHVSIWNDVFTDVTVAPIYNLTLGVFKVGCDIVRWYLLGEIFVIFEELTQAVCYKNKHYASVR